MSIPVELAEALFSAEFYDLSQPYEPGMPVWPGHPEFSMALTKRHGDVIRPGGGSSAGEILILGGHVGTHLDACSHISVNGRLHGGVDAMASQKNTGFAQLDVGGFVPGIFRCVFLDVASAMNVEVLDSGTDIDAKLLQLALDRAGCVIHPGDCLLIRSGMAKYWRERSTYLGTADGLTGVGVTGADWLADKQVSVAGTDTIAFEVIATGQRTLPVHERLLAQAGTLILEALNLDGLVGLPTAVFALSLAPLRLIGATGAPIRPIAIPIAE